MTQPHPYKIDLGLSIAFYNPAKGEWLYKSKTPRYVRKQSDKEKPPHDFIPTMESQYVSQFEQQVLKPIAIELVKKLKSFTKQ